MNGAMQSPAEKDVALDSSSAGSELISQFRHASTSMISDCLDRLPCAVGLRPFHRVEATMVGVALTVRVPAGDNLMIHKALDLIRSGDVLVVDAEGETSRAVVGGIIALIAKTKGASGIVIDGAIRDLAEIGVDDFPCFARAVCHRGPYKHGPGQINVPVSIGGMVISPGDVVVGDADGVVAFPTAIVSELITQVAQLQRKEEDIVASIRAGTYTGAYGQ
jgi:regulator of RNase E activity RraA